MGKRQRSQFLSRPGLYLSLEQKRPSIDLPPTHNQLPTYFSLVTLTASLAYFSFSAF